MSSSAATVKCGSASAFPVPCSRAHSITACSVNSPYLTKPHLVQWPSNLIVRSKRVVITCVLPVAEGYRFPASSSSFKFLWFATTGNQRWPATTSWVYWAVPPKFLSTKTSSKMATNRLRPPALWNRNPATCSVPHSVYVFVCLSHRICTRTTVPRHGTLIPRTNLVRSSRALFFPLRPVSRPRCSAPIPLIIP